jgi:hypothetical protein
MFEGLFASILSAYVGKYIEGLQGDNLSLGVQVSAVLHHYHSVNFSPI